MPCWTVCFTAAAVAETLLSPVLQVPKGQRVNRATLAIFKFESGAVGSLNHTLLLHGSNFFTELDIFGDGFHIIVKDPYQHPAVLVRRPHSDDYEQVRARVAGTRLVMHALPTSCYCIGWHRLQSKC